MSPIRGVLDYCNSYTSHNRCRSLDSGDECVLFDQYEYLFCVHRWTRGQTRDSESSHSQTAAYSGTALTVNESR